ncbi:MAG: hypothetical protein H7X86_12820 [Gorillibacterium sp.]|nr:hypothetical protein [Gorillibacterium sp.]
MWKIFFIKSDGSVSVYLIIILLPIFLFNAVLIDLVRFKLAERESDRAVKAAVRSVLAEYQTDLRPYGLFGREDNKDAMRSVFGDMVSKNIPKSVSQGSHHSLWFNPDDGEVKGFYSLANHQIFRKQVNEDMKYKAPIEFTLELVEKFKNTGVSNDMKSTSDLFANAQSLEKKWTKVNDMLDKSWLAAKNLANLAQTLESDYASRLTTINELAVKIGLHDVVRVTESLNQIQVEAKQANEQVSQLRSSLLNNQSSLQMLQKNAKKNAVEIASLKANILALEHSLSTLEGSIHDLSQRKVTLEQLLVDLASYATEMERAKRKAPLDYEHLNQLFQELNTHLTTARAANAELRLEKEQLIAKLSGSDPSTKSIYESIPVWDEQFFTLYLTEGDRLPALFSGFTIRLTSAGLIAGGLYEQLVETNRTMGEKAKQFMVNRQELEQERAERIKAIRGKQEEQQSLIKKTLAEVNGVLGSCGIWGTEDAYSNAYQQLSGLGEGAGSGLYAKYMLYNSAGRAEAGTEGLNLPNSASNQNLDNAMSLASRLGQLLLDARGELYLNEYALSRFSYRTSAAKSATDRSLAGQEAEYILYGQGSCASNYGAAYGEMFMVFFAIRTIEALTDPRIELLNVGSPLLVFLAAAAKGAAEAYMDMNKLVAGKDIPVIKKLPGLTLTYKDMLRVLFLLHSNDRKMMSRMQALIELNTNLDLTKQTTFIRGEAKTSFRLLFLPGVASKLGRPLYGTIQGDRIIISSVAVMDY